MSEQFSISSHAKKQTQKKEIYNAVKKIHDIGIYIIGNYILGLPEDDLDSMQETIDLAMELNCEFANIYCAMAYPGSKLYEDALNKGWKLPDSWLGYSQHSYDTLPLPTKYLQGPEVLQFRDQAFKKYFTNDKYIESMRFKFGEQAVEEIQFMLKKDLKRKWLE